jgi:hypothetical protein
MKPLRPITALHEAQADGERYGETGRAVSRWDRRGGVRRRFFVAAGTG